jgi:fumarate reductase flavoprotein subunit
MSVRPTTARRSRGPLLVLAWGLLLGPGGLWAICAWSEDLPLLADRHKNAGLTCGACHDEGRPETEPPAAGCVRCHGDLVKMGERTRAVPRNPHASHKGDLECRMCHRAHRPSTDWCAQCHTSVFRVP